MFNFKKDGENLLCSENECVLNNELHFAHQSSKTPESIKVIVGYVMILLLLKFLIKTRSCTVIHCAPPTEYSHTFWFGWAGGKRVHDGIYIFFYFFFLFSYSQNPVKLILPLIMPCYTRQMRALCTNIFMMDNIWPPFLKSDFGSWSQIGP